MVVVKVDINTLKSDFPKFKKDLLNLNEYMYKNPELGYQEFESVQKITSLITKNVPNAKFNKFKKIPTAFTASFNQKPHNK